MNSSTVVDRRFAQLLGARLPELEREAASVVGFWSDFRIAYTNPAWAAFASQNGGREVPTAWGLGADMLRAIPETLRDFYRAFYLSALSEPDAFGTPPGHEYECSSPTTRRRFLLSAYPLANGEGGLAVHSLVFEAPMGEETAVASDGDGYRQGNGIVVQCAHCRRTRHPELQRRWDWVPALVQRMPANTSHGLCPVCVAHYYGE